VSIQIHGVEQDSAYHQPTGLISSTEVGNFSAFGPTDEERFVVILSAFGTDDGENADEAARAVIATLNMGVTEIGSVYDRKTGEMHRVTWALQGGSAAEKGTTGRYIVVDSDGDIIDYIGTRDRLSAWRRFADYIAENGDEAREWDDTGWDSDDPEGIPLAWHLDDNGTTIIWDPQ
jgi:hypothetical protein